MKKQYKCEICKRAISSGFQLDPDEQIPEIKQTVYFCSRRCQNAFVGAIKRSRTKNIKSEWRAELEQKDEELDSDEDFYRLFETLTTDERKILISLGIGDLMSQTKTLKGFYKLLGEKVERYRK